MRCAPLPTAGRCRRRPRAPSAACSPISSPVTFNSDVAPLIFDRCATCHRPTGAAPFSLLTYADVRQRATLDRRRHRTAATCRRGKPTRSRATFVGQKRLSDAEIGLIGEWVDERRGRRRRGGSDRATGVRGRLAARHARSDRDDGEAVRPRQHARPTRSASSSFRCRSATTKYVTGLEFQPGNPRVVHHANIRLDRTRGSRDLDERDPAPGYDGLMARSAIYPDGHFLGWTPGQVAPLAPANMAWRLDPGTDLVVQLHMQPSGAPEPVQPVIGLLLRRRSCRRARRRSCGSARKASTSRPANRATSSPIPTSCRWTSSCRPFSRTRTTGCARCRGPATLPDGSGARSFTSRDWDFRWQHVYRYVTPIALPKGTRLSMRYTYDNSAGNPRNPQRAAGARAVGPAVVRRDGRPLVSVRDAPATRDRARLNGEILRKMTAEDVIGYETMLRADPDDTELHDDVALLYLSLGRAQPMPWRTFARRRRSSRSAVAHFNLATALTVAGNARRSGARVPLRAGAQAGLRQARTTTSARCSRRRASWPTPSRTSATRRGSIRRTCRRTGTSRGISRPWRPGSGGAVDEAVAAGRTRRGSHRAEPIAQVLDALGAAYAAAGRFDDAIADGRARSGTGRRRSRRRDSRTPGALPPSPAVSVTLTPPETIDERLRAPPLRRRVSRPDRRGDGHRQQSRRLEHRLRAAAARRVARLDADRSGVSVLPLHRRRLHQLCRLRASARWPASCGDAAVIFGLGLFLAGFPFFNVTTWRVPGRAAANRALLSGGRRRHAADGARRAADARAPVAHRGRRRWS